jgi:hypothetical protein
LGWLSEDWMLTVWTGDHEGALKVLNHEDIVSYLTKEVERMNVALCHDVLKEGATPKSIDAQISDQIIKEVLTQVSI